MLGMAGIEDRQDDDDKGARLWGGVGGSTRQVHPKLHLPHREQPHKCDLFRYTVSMTILSSCSILP